MSLEMVMKKRFMGLCGRLNTRSIVPADVFGDLNIRYSQEERRYHTLKHIQDSLDTFWPVRSLATQPDLIEWALWFHDAIYDTHSTENVVQSAEMAYAYTRRAGLGILAARYVRNLVLATKHDFKPQVNAQSLMADVDLAILGQVPSVFDEYEESIRSEYSWVSEETFRRERAKILRGFLDRDHIYHTDNFRMIYESTAQANLERSLERLAA